MEQKHRKPFAPRRALDLVGTNAKGNQVLPYMVEVELNQPTDGGNPFTRVVETLQRIGVSSDGDNNQKTLYQSCHILNKRGKYYVTHFKNLLMLDGCDSNLSVYDVARQNTVVKMLQNWNLVKAVHPEQLDGTDDVSNSIMVIKSADRANYNLRAKYVMGSKRQRQPMRILN